MDFVMHGFLLFVWVFKQKSDKKTQISSTEVEGSDKVTFLKWKATENIKADRKKDRGRRKSNEKTLKIVLSERKSELFQSLWA